MARYRAWLIALYIPDQIEWLVCRSVEEEWLTFRRKLSGVHRAEDLRLVAAYPFLSVREAASYRQEILAMSPRLRFEAVSVVNPDWENLMDQPEMLALFRQFPGDEEDGGGAAARLPKAPRDPILLGEFGQAQAWPEIEEFPTEAARERALRERFASWCLSEERPRRDPEEELLSRLDRT
jgi:hypothetical protein